MDNDFSAVVFDCDGVLLDTETHWTAAEENLFGRYDKIFDPDAKREMLGTSFEASAMILERLLEQPGRANSARSWLRWSRSRCLPMRNRFPESPN